MEQNNSTRQINIKLGIAGMGAVGQAVAKALNQGIDGYTLKGYSDLEPRDNVNVPYCTLPNLVKQCDLIIEALPAASALSLIDLCIKAQKDLILISPAALLLTPDIIDKIPKSGIKVEIPSGALAGLDGIKAMRETGLNDVKIITTKPPKGLQSAPYVQSERLDLSKFDQMTTIFEGNAIEAAKGFPANINVAASLSFAGIGPEKTKVEIRIDPNSNVNQHRIVAQTDLTRLETTIESKPDPQNPKSSALTAQSIIAFLRDRSRSIRVGT